MALKVLTAVFFGLTHGRQTALLDAIHHSAQLLVKLLSLIFAAALVAECPVPVWVGIGHEKDSVILDEVAHTSFDTPSKVILGIESHLTNITHQAKDLMAKLIKNASSRLSAASQNNQRQLERIQRSSTHAIVLAKKDTLYQIKHLKSSSKYQRQHLNQQLSILINRIKQSSLTAVSEAKKDSRQHFERHRSVFQHTQKLRQDCRNLQSLILVQHPRRTLEKGFAIIHDTSHQAKVIDRTRQLSVGQRVKISFQDGNAIAVIDKITPTANTPNTTTEETL